MKQITITLMMTAFAVALYAQTDAEKKMNKRAREFYNMITVNDKNSWIKFIEANFTKALQEKPFSKRVQGNSEGGDVLIAKSNEEATNLDAKAALFDQLHRDFGTAKLKSLTTKNNESEIVVENNGQFGTFKLKFTDKDPYLIDGLNVQVRKE